VSLEQEPDRDSRGRPWVRPLRGEQTGMP